MTKYVTPVEFLSIQCNRCGDCCERMILDEAPEAKMARLQDNPDARFINMTREESLAEQQFVVDMLEPLEDSSYYRCKHFRRDSPTQGTCTAYEKRPKLCSEFPYGQPNRGWPRCSWNVRIAKGPQLPMMGKE